MQQLITIETVPISIKYSGTQPVPVLQEPKTSEKTSDKAEVKNEVKASLGSASTKAPGLAKPIRHRTDSYVQGGSVDGSFNLTYTATPKFDEDGKLSLNIKMGNTESLNAMHFGKDIHNMLDQVFGEQQNNNFGLNEMKLNIDFSDLQKAVPGSGKTGATFNMPNFEIEILEMPKVIIKYVGGPIYIPRSADPNYEAPPWEE